MTKRTSLTLRKPGQRPDPKIIEAFIEAGEDASPESTSPAASVSTPTTTPVPPHHHLRVQSRSDHQQSFDAEVPTFRRANRSLAKRKTKPDRRRTTVYMDLEIARKLAAHCATIDQDMSDVVNEALHAYLA